MTSSSRPRHPRLFLVSSSSTTSTLTTTTLCYSTASTGFTTTACGRKKRAIYTDPVTGEQGFLELDGLIQPQAPKRYAKLNVEAMQWVFFKPKILICFQDRVNTTSGQNNRCHFLMHTWPFLGIQVNCVH